MKQKELNFQMLALFPAIFISGFGVSFIYRSLYLRFQRKTTYQKIKVLLVETEKYLTHLLDSESISIENNEKFECDLSPFNEGKLLLKLHEIQLQSYGIERNFKKLFLSDLMDLQNSRSHLQQRISTTQRMYRTYPWLLSH